MDYQRLLELTEKVLILRGGKGSGNFGHKGRKGKRGGSTSRKATGSVAISDTEKETANQIYTAFKAIPSSPIHKGPEAYYGMLSLLKGSNSLGTIQEMGNLYENDSSIPKPKSLSLPSTIKNAKNAKHQESIKEFEPWMNSLTEKEKAGLRSYQREDYEGMNGHLRRGVKISGTERDDVKSARKALEKSSLKKDTILYRGTDPDVFVSQLGTDPTKWLGQTFTDKGFMSTSIDESASFGDLKFKILAPKGTKGGYLGNLPPPHRHNEGEKEMLLAPGTRIRIIGVDIGPTGRIENVTTQIIGQD